MSENTSHVSRLWNGQDIPLGPQQNDVPPAQVGLKRAPFPESARQTESIKLRLEPGDALALRVAAAKADLPISTFVARLVNAHGDFAALRYDEDEIADASSLAAAVASIPREVHALRGELRHLGGLIKSFFVTPETMQTAERYSLECASTLHALMSNADAAVPVLRRLEDQLANIRANLERYGSRLARGR